MIWGTSLAQNNHNQTDTIRIPYLYLQKCCINPWHLYMTGGKCFLDDVPITREEFDKMDSLKTYICDSIIDKSQGKYCKFYNKDSVVIEEGIWYREYYVGIYKKYYDNGVLNTLGYYSDGKNKSSIGDKVGKWYYYNRKGKLIKTVDYSKKQVKPK